MDATFKTMSLHYMVKLVGANYSDVLGAIKATGLRGHMVRGERVWTNEEFQQIKQKLGK